MNHSLTHTKTQANSCKVKQSMHNRSRWKLFNLTYITDKGLVRNDTLSFVHEVFSNFFPVIFQRHWRMRIGARLVMWEWELFCSSVIFGAATIDCRWQSASRHGVKKAPQHWEPEEAAKMSETGNQEPAATPNDTRRPPRPAVGNKVTVVLGAQWGDEGKGKVVDLLAQDADMVCRCQVG